MTFAEWVTMRRKAAGLSQIEAAERASVHQTVWSDWENNNRQPQKKTVEKIAVALGVPRAEALEAAGYQAAPIDIPAEWARLWTETPASQRSRLLKITKGAQEALSL